MKLGPRGKLLLVMALFVAPIAASVIAYNFAHVRPTANYGELISPPAAVPALAFSQPDGTPWRFADLSGRWILVVSDAADCPEACLGKLVTLRQVRLGLGRNASRVERVFVVEDGRAPKPEVLAPFAGLVVAIAPPGSRMPAGAGHDREHIYLADPHGNVMMRWPAAADGRRMLKDLERLLKASQIG